MWISIENWSSNFISRCHKSQTNLKNIPKSSLYDMEQFIKSTYDNSTDLIEDIQNLGITYIINQEESDYYIYDFGNGKKSLFFDSSDEYDNAGEKAKDLRELADIYDHMEEVDIDIIIDHIQ